MGELIDTPVTEFARLIASNERRHLLGGLNRYENDLIERVDAA